MAVRASYNGYYLGFPSQRRGFDSLRPLQQRCTRRVSLSSPLFPPALRAVPTVSINGESHSVAPGANLATALGAIDLAGKRFAVELNGAVVPRSQLATTTVADGDRIEVVIAVGGG